MYKTLRNIALAGFLTAAIAPIAEAAPAKIWTSYENTTLSQQQCKSKAERTIRDAGYDYQVVQSGVYGEDGDYSVTIRCMTDYNLVFFIVTHPNTDYASEELRLVIDDF